MILQSELLILCVITQSARSQLVATRRMFTDCSSLWQKMVYTPNTLLDTPKPGQKGTPAGGFIGSGLKGAEAMAELVAMFGSEAAIIGAGIIGAGDAACKKFPTSDWCKVPK